MKVVEAPSNNILVSAIETAALLISTVEPEATTKLVPESKVKVPLVKLSLVSERRNEAESIPSRVSVPFELANVPL